MWNPATDTCIEDAALSANKLNELLDLMHANYGRMNLPQCEALLGLALIYQPKLLFG